MERLVVDVPVIGLLAAVMKDPCCVEIVSCWGTLGAGRLLLPVRACLWQLVEREVPRGYKFPHL